jgi:ERCC4-related helicase
MRSLGLSNVMISTDIVQKGLDVPECSFVICYAFVSNEIGTVQSRKKFLFFYSCG